MSMTRIRVGHRRRRNSVCCTSEINGNDKIRLSSDSGISGTSNHRRHSSACCTSEIDGNDGLRETDGNDGLRLSNDSGISGTSNYFANRPERAFLDVILKEGCDTFHRPPTRDARVLYYSPANILTRMFCKAHNTLNVQRTDDLIFKFFEFREKQLQLLGAKREVLRWVRTHRPLHFVTVSFEGNMPLYNHSRNEVIRHFASEQIKDDDDEEDDKEDDKENEENIDEDAKIPSTIYRLANCGSINWYPGSEM